MSKKSFIDSVKVGVPCSEDWEKMRGNDRVRFCSHCTKEVNNLSAISRKEAARLVRASGGGICIRYIAHPVTQRPMFGEQMVQITRRTPALAAGIMTASLALSTMAYAQTVPSAPEPASPVAASERSDSDKEQEKADESEPTDPTPGIIEGIVLDTLGHPVPNIQIVLDNADGSGRVDNQSTDVDGRYKFDEVEAGVYTIRIMSSSGLWKKAARGIKLVEGEQTFRNIYVKVKVPEEGVGSGVGSGSGWGFGGAMAVVEYALPLNRAVADGDTDAVRKLLAEGETANGRDKNYNNLSPLHIAVENGNVEIVKLLLDHGANVNARNDSELTPLMFIDEDATPLLIKILLNAGAKVDARDETGEDVLLSTIDSISVDVLKALIKGGADVRHADETGVTALMKAAEDEDVEKVAALVLAGAGVDDRDKQGESAWDKTSSMEIEEFLEAHGASADNNTIEVMRFSDDDTDEEETDEITIDENVIPPASTIEVKGTPGEDKPAADTVAG